MCKMLGLLTTPISKSPTKIPNLPPIQSSASNNPLLPLRNLTFPFVPLKPPLPPRTTNLSSAVVVRAGGPTTPPEKEEETGKGNGRPRLNFRRWIDLVLDPGPDNLVAVGLTGLLTWASVQVLWQLFFISLAILVAALKYSFIAAILLFILITLL